MESVVIDMCEEEDFDIVVDEEELDLAARGGRLLRDPPAQDGDRNLKTGRAEEVVVKEVNGRNPRLRDMADKLAEFFCNPQLCKDDYADLFLMYLGKFVAFCIF